MHTNFFTFGSFLAFIFCLTDVSCFRRKCTGSSNNYCSGESTNMRAVCKGGYCYCDGQDYDYYSCLPNAFGCKVVENADTALGIPRRSMDEMPQDIYSCTPGSSSKLYEVHVLSQASVPGIKHIPPVPKNVTVKIISLGKSIRPIVLVLGCNFDVVNWILDLPADITVSKVILVDGYANKSSVSGVCDQATERKSYQWGMGYGEDNVIGDTVALLRKLYNRFGIVSSFTGVYEADEWTLEVSVSSSEASQHHTCPAASSSLSLSEYKTAGKLYGILAIAAMIINKQFVY